MNSELSRKISTIRQDRGYSQNELAKLASIPQSTISEIEAGNRENPGILTIKKIATALNITVTELIGEKPPAESA